MPSRPSVSLTIASSPPSSRAIKLASSGGIAASASGFIYHVSKLGVTGSQGLPLEEIGRKVKQLRSVTNLPVCVGFGISTPIEVAAVAALCDGVVIGSAFERLIEENIGKPDLPDLLAARVSALKHETRPPSS